MSASSGNNKLKLRFGRINYFVEVVRLLRRSQLLGQQLWVDIDKIEGQSAGLFGRPEKEYLPAWPAGLFIDVAPQQ
jgi:hypothetical protein